VTLCVLAAALLWCAPALAISQRGHVFSFSYGAKGSGKGGFSEPLGVAVNDVTGNVYVADHKNKRVEQLEPVLSEKGELVGERYVRSESVPSPSGVAVDDSTEGSGPSRGDVYVVGSSGKAIYKFSSEGHPVGEPLKKFVLKETGAKEKLEAVEGVAVDPAGSLFVYQEDGRVFEFGDGEPGEGALVMETGLKGAPGLALDSEDDLFVGVLGEGGFPVMSKLEGITGKVLIGALDDEDTPAVAVNTADVPANEVDERNDVYVDNVSEASGEKQTTVAQFAPEAEGKAGELIQRFGAPGVAEGEAVAVDDQTGTVYTTDAASDELDVFELEPSGPPRIEGLSAQSSLPPAPDARRLSAQVDPNGADTQYYFEYGASSCTATPSSCTKSTPAELGEGFGDKEVSLELQGLAPGTYHYRVVAESSFGTVDSAEQTFTILGLMAGLPDGRAWEMVSSPDKYGAAVEALTNEGGVILAGEDGDALTYVADGAITEEAQGNRTPELQQVLATRAVGGWSSQDIVTPNSRAEGVSAGNAPEYQFFSPDLSLALVRPWATSPVSEPPLAPGAAQSTMYLRNDATGGYEALVSEANVPAGTKFGNQVSFVSATPDLSHVLLRSSVALTETSLTEPSPGPGLYEWSGGELRYVSELPTGTPAPEAVLGYRHVAANAISADGTRVIWTDSSESPGALYMRDTATGETIRLDAAEQGVAEPPEASARFQTASSDGSRVFFTDKQRLTVDSTAEAGQGAGKPDLYECEVLEEHGKLVCHLRDLTVDHTEGEHAGVQGLLFGASEDGSSVYLLAEGVLAANENGNGETAEPGKDNLYELHYDGTEWTRTFIATLSGEDSPEWEGNTIADTAFLTARVSPNGRYLAFMSQKSLTGYDNEDVSSRHVGERLDEEVYLFDASTASLTCVSCDPSGARPAGVLDTQSAGEGIGLLVDRRETWVGHWLAGNIPGWTAQSLVSALYQSRYLSNEGRLFFNSADALVPLERPTRNETVEGVEQEVGNENVYEYEPAGVGSCESASGGCVALISSGTSPNESAFLEATPSGNDVFFLTAAQLLPQDTDTAFDIYDARVCTPSSPCLTPPSPVPEGCSEADACRPASPAQQAPLGASGSETFSGAGNLAPPPAKQEVKGLKTAVKPLTRAQQLADGLKACRKQHAHSKKKRQACEAHSRKLYGPKPKAKKSTQAKRSSSGRSGRGRG
jgi:DNA-binding beta-propeller fold protein YncE